jgi:DnaJ-class molecular chaperone
MSEDYYKILELPETAAIDEIKKSYRRLSLLHHPDRNGNSADSVAKFQKISDAYETLGDADKKRDYDMTRNNPFIKMMSGPNPFGPNPFGPNPFGQGNPFGPNPFGQGPNMNQMDDILAGLFGLNMNQGNPFGQGQNIRIFHNGMPININQNHNHNQKPQSIMVSISVPIDKILTGTTVPIDIERWVMENSNKVFEHETIYVSVPKGMDEGELIVLKDKGHIVNENCKGDIKIVVKIENNTNFQRQGLDLILQKTISIKEALCGFTFDLKYITGKTYTINNNAGNIIPNGYKKVIPNMGFSRDEHIGNLIIVFDVKFPEKLSDPIIDALKAIEF